MPLKIDSYVLHTIIAHARPYQRSPCAWCYALLDPGPRVMSDFQLWTQYINVDRSSVFGLKGHSLTFVFPEFGSIHNLSLDHNYKPHLKSTHEKKIKVTKSLAQDLQFS